jgi:hypothetical protein
MMLQLSDTHVIENVAYLMGSDSAFGDCCVTLIHILFSPLIMEMIMVLSQPSERGHRHRLSLRTSLLAPFIMKRYLSTFFVVEAKVEYQ